MPEKIISATAYLTTKGKLFILFHTNQDTIRGEVKIQSGYCEVILRSDLPNNEDIFKTSAEVKPSNPILLRDIVDRSRTFKIAHFENY